MSTRYAATLILLMGVLAPAWGAEPACERKAQAIQKQIEIAEAAGNRSRLNGLQKALSSVKSYCTDAGLIADKQKDIAEQQEEIDELRAEIQEKTSEGRDDKVTKLERKLAREQAELQILEQELAGLRQP